MEASIEKRLKIGNWRIIPPLKRVFTAYPVEEDAIPTVTKTESYDMNDLKRLDNRALELLIMDIAKENHIYAAMGGSGIVPDGEGGWTWHDCWMGQTYHRDEHEFLVHKAYALMVCVVFPDIFYNILHK